MLPAQNDIQRAEIYRWVETSYTAIGRVLDEFSDPAFPEFRTLATKVIASAKQRYNVVGNAIPWLTLPLATAEAVKATAPAAAQIGAGFELARMAAGLLDQCIDQDTEDALWTKIGIGPTMTLASGLTCLSLLAVSQLSEVGVSAEVASQIRTEFELTWLRMCGAQQKELTTRRNGDTTEETYWAIARGKSGCFFELGCKAAAMLVPDMTPNMLGGYASFGNHVGMMLQLINDLQGMWGVQGKKDIGQLLTLPIIHARATLSDKNRSAFDRLLADAANDESATTAAREIIECSGALQYTLIQIQLYRDRAAQSLAVCEDPPVLHQMLSAFLPLNLADGNGNTS